MRCHRAATRFGLTDASDYQWLPERGGTLGGCNESGRGFNSFEIHQYHRCIGVIEQRIDIVRGFQPRLISNGDDRAERQPSRPSLVVEGVREAAALCDHSNASAMVAR